MPIYEYLCTSCGHRTDIVHGINDPGPAFCPSCGAESTMRKQFAPPAIHYKGSGWAKKDRGGAGATKAASAPARKPDTEAGASAGASATSSSHGDQAKSDKPAGSSTAGASTGSGE